MENINQLNSNYRKQPDSLYCSVKFEAFSTHLYHFKRFLCDYNADNLVVVVVVVAVVVAVVVVVVPSKQENILLAAATSKLGC